LESSELMKRINSFAHRSFRNTADKDYIHARMAYQGDLYPQFLWSSIHALEKYVKCILLLNRVPLPKKRIGHEVCRSLELLKNKDNPVDIKLSEETNKFLERLEKFGAKYRYLEVSWFAGKDELFKLDKAVWEIRKYCNSGVYIYEASPTVYFNAEVYERITKSNTPDKQNTLIPNGWLENVLSHKNHPARSNLVWNNLYYTTANRKVVKNKSGIMFENSPFYLNPELIDAVSKYVIVPKEIKNAHKNG